ncbi:MAG TPA: lysophospholipid acyltransferase family protein [Casimicrobiaceae bacterium]|nr:lysophospholipid acyltransferase family protein [Casimicrobiaceae bacterium]
MRTLLKALTRVPLPILYTWSSIVYFVAFRLLRWRRIRAELDLARVLPERSAAERSAILRRSYRNLADTLFEAFWGYGASAEDLRRRVTIENPQPVIDCIEAKQSVILLAAHYGNWEWLSLATGARFGGTIDVVYQPQRVAAIDSFLREARARFGSRLVPRKEFIFDLMSRAGTPRIYALIADQTPKGRDPRHWTRFLGQDTAFFLGAGKIARFLDATVFYVSMRRVRRGYYSVRLSSLAEPPYDETADRLVVERFAQRLEQDIRDSPADWLWLQNKWKYAKPATSRPA